MPSFIATSRSERSSGVQSTTIRSWRWGVLQASIEGGLEEGSTEPTVGGFGWTTLAAFPDGQPERTARAAAAAARTAAGRARMARSYHAPCARKRRRKAPTAARLLRWCAAVGPMLRDRSALAPQSGQLLR